MIRSFDDLLESIIGEKNRKGRKDFARIIGTFVTNTLKATVVVMEELVGITRGFIDLIKSINPSNWKMVKKKLNEIINYINGNTND